MLNLPVSDLDQLQRQSAVIQTNNQEWMKGLSNQLLVTFGEQLKGTIERQMMDVQSNMEKNMGMVAQRLQDNLYANVRCVVKEEVAKAIADGQQALNDTVMKVLRSQAPTPIPSAAQQIDRTQIMSELNQQVKTGQYNTAFQQVSVLVWDRKLKCLWRAICVT